MKKFRYWLYPLLCACVTVLSLTGCAGSTGTEEAETVSENKAREETGVDIAEDDPFDDEFEDNRTIYEDPEKIETMYLTVSRGNAGENTDHTWEEINSYSDYDYQKMGVPRYQVEGLLQIGESDGKTLDPDGLGFGRETPNCRVSIRGQTSTLFRYKNYKIRLDEDAGEWDGQSVINLNKHMMDGLRFRNKMMFDLQSQIPHMVSMKTTFVHLYVKDETSENGDGQFHDYGLYTQVEQPNKKFLLRHGLDRFAHLYKENKIFEFGKNDAIRLVTDPDYDEEEFSYYLKTKGDQDHSKLLDLIDDVNDASVTPDDLLDTWLDRDNLAAWLAFNILTGNIDTQSRNTLLYSSLNSHTWYLMDWDCDGGFLQEEKRVLGKESPDADGWENGVSNYWGNHLFQKALKSESFRKELEEKVEELYEGILSPENVQKMADHYAEIVKPYLYEGHDVGNLPLTASEYQRVESAVGKEVEDNREKFYASLERPQPFFIGNPSVEGNEIEFHWDASFDFQKDLITYSFELADNLNFDHPLVKKDGLETPEYEYEGKLKPGEYFIRVTASDADGNRTSSFDICVDGSSIKHYGVLCFYVNEDGSLHRKGE